MIKFTKMEGLGNDYIYVDCISDDLNVNDRVIQKNKNIYVFAPFSSFFGNIFFKNKTYRNFVCFDVVVTNF